MATLRLGCWIPLAPEARPAAGHQIRTGLVPGALQDSRAVFRPGWPPGRWWGEAVAVGEEASTLGFLVGGAWVRSPDAGMTTLRLMAWVSQLPDGSASARWHLCSRATRSWHLKAPLMLGPSPGRPY